jgi:hypothetical protein
MAITTFDPGWIAAAVQSLLLNKTTSRTSIATSWFSLFDIAGNPGAGTLAGTSTANGVVQTDAIAGYPTIDAFGGSNAGYIGRLAWSSSVACRIRLYDRLFVCGAYAFNANTALSSQPSFLGRIPGGTAAFCAGQTELWVETVTAATGNQTWNVTYTNEAGTGGRTTGAVGIGAAPTVGRCWQLPLAAGDRGVSLITNVAGGTGTVGTANIMVLRRIGEVRIPVVGYGEVQGLLQTGAPTVFADSALYMLVCPDSTATGTPELAIDIKNG